VGCIRIQVDDEQTGAFRTLYAQNFFSGLVFKIALGCMKRPLERSKAILNENAAVAIKFKPVQERARAEVSASLPETKRVSAKKATHQMATHKFQPIRFS